MALLLNLRLIGLRVKHLFRILTYGVFFYIENEAMISSFFVLKSIKKDLYLHGINQLKRIFY